VVHGGEEAVLVDYGDRGMDFCKVDLSSGSISNH
jgi:hypothetical protein